jgi:pimeloyl-ACP methyl ester carboxylesterase
MQIEVKGRRLWFDVDGVELVPEGPTMRERPRVVLVHGGPGSFDHSYFKPDFGRLAEVAEVLYLDLPGHGRSDWGDPAKWSFELCADALRDFCDALAIARPVVYGHSLGAMVTLLYAARNPDHAGALVLQSAMGRFDLGRIVEGFRRAGGNEAAALAERVYGGDSRPVASEEWAPVWKLVGHWVPGNQERARTLVNRELNPIGLELMRSFDVLDQPHRLPHAGLRGRARPRHAGDCRAGDRRRIPQRYRAAQGSRGRGPLHLEGRPASLLAAGRRFRHVATFVFTVFRLRISGRILSKTTFSSIAPRPIFRPMDQANFPWRPLGAVFVEEDLLEEAELESALAEQRRTGRLLGEILVARGHLTSVALARALARQHGVELRSTRLEPDVTPDPGSTRSSLAKSAVHQRPWRPLGAVLVENGLLPEAALQDALAEKAAHPNRRLGEILVERGHVSGAELAWALAEQHGLDFETRELPRDVEAVVVPVVDGQPTYQVFSVAWGATQERRTMLYEGSNLLDAADFACDYVDREQPVAVEIERRDGEERETVWTYSRDRAEEAASSSKSLVETFGFDPTRWGTSP